MLLSERRARDLGVQGLARVAAFADQAVEPSEVAKAPSVAISGSEAAITLKYGRHDDRR